MEYQTLLVWKLPLGREKVGTNLQLALVLIVRLAPIMRRQQDAGQ